MSKARFHPLCAALVALTLIEVSCLPEEDLSSYSRAVSEPARQPGAELPAEALDASTSGGDVGTDIDRVDEAPNPSLPRVDAGVQGTVGSGSIDAGGVDADAGSIPDAGAEPPVVDAGGVALADAALESAALCASLDGTLQPGTRDCFVVSATPATWQGAVAGCQALGMELVSVGSLERDRFLSTLTATPVWLGGRDPSFFMFPGFANPTANGFIWLDGTAVDDLNWAPGEPDDAAGEFCIEKSADAGGGWFERACTEQKPFICERSF
jgi:hypothetical protein